MSRIFSNSPCRNCNHYHTKSIGDEMILSCVHYPPFEMANCLCDYKDYAPSDNLEFLEWCVEKKGEDK